MPPKKKQKKKKKDIRLKIDMPFNEAVKTAFATVRKK